jgi:hypothetical protein
MSGYAITYLLLNLFALGVLAAKHGEPKTGDISIWPSLIIWGCVTLPLLYMGGFFQ